MRVTITDIANEAGVTKSTVSLVLNNRPLGQRMAQETRQRIIAIAKRLDYQPSFVAKSLSTGKTKSLGLIVGDIDTPHYAEMVNAALEAVERRGHQLLISITKWSHEKEITSLDFLMQRQVDGVIFCSSSLTPEKPICKKIMEKRFPLVLYNMVLPEISSVISDHKIGMREALSLLCNNGHRRVGFVTATMELTNKEIEFGESCRHYGIEPLYIHEAYQDNWHELVFKKLNSQGNKLKALVISADHLAQKLIGHFYRHGLLVPQDIDIISVDGTKWSTYGYPALTSIKQNRTLMMENAVELLLKPNNKAEIISIPTSLIIRDSVKIDTLRPSRENLRNHGSD